MKKSFGIVLFAYVLLFWAVLAQAWLSPSGGGGGGGGGGGPTVLFTTPTPVAGQFLTGPPGAITGVTIAGDSTCSVAGNTATCTNNALNGFGVVAATPTVGCIVQGIAGNKYACVTPSPTPSATPTIAAVMLPIPPGLLYYGTGAEADPAISSGTTTIQGEHDYAALTISGSGQLAVGTTLGQRWALVRVAGACSLATTATCVKEDGTNDTACAVKAVGNGIAGGGGASFLGSSGGGGGAAGTVNNGGAGGGVNSTLGVYTIGGASGGTFATPTTTPQAGSTPSPGQAASYLETLSHPLDILLWAGAGSTNLSWGGSNSGAGGAGTGAAGTKNAGGLAFVLVCKSFTTMTGHIVASGGPGGAGTSCGNAGGGGGGAGGDVVVSGPGGYSGTIDVNGGNGGAACAGGQNGAAGGKGTGFNCNTTSGVCTQL